MDERIYVGAEALIALEAWSGAVVPCDIIEIYNVDGKPIKDDSEINDKCSAQIRVYAGSAEELRYRQREFIFSVPVRNLSF